MFQTIRNLSLSSLVTIGVVAVGCGPSPSTAKKEPFVGHEQLHKLPEDIESHVSESFAAAVQEVDSLRSRVQAAFAAKEPAKADEAVHEIGHILEELTKLSANENFSAEEQAAVKQAAEGLLDCFGKIDDTLHGRKGSTYADEAEPIEAAMKVLRDIVTIHETRPAAEEK